MAAKPNPDATLPRLPTELLLIIAEDLEPHDNLHLSYTNRFLWWKLSGEMSRAWHGLSPPDRARFLPGLAVDWWESREGQSVLVHHHAWPCTIGCSMLHKIRITVRLYDRKVDIRGLHHYCLTQDSFSALRTHLSDADVHLALRYYRTREASDAFRNVLLRLLAPRSLSDWSFSKGVRGRMSPKIVDGHYLLHVQWMWDIEHAGHKPNGTPQTMMFFRGGSFCPHTSVTVWADSTLVHTARLPHWRVHRRGEWRYEEDGGVRLESGFRAEGICPHCSMDWQIVVCDTRLLARTWYNLGAGGSPRWNSYSSAQPNNVLFNRRYGRGGRCTTRDMYELPGLGGETKPGSDIFEFWRDHETPEQREQRHEEELKRLWRERCHQGKDQ